MTLALLLLSACGRFTNGPDVYTGTIEATEVEVASTVAGRLLEVVPHEGDRVAVGDLIFTLDAAPYAAERDLRAAGVAYADAAIAAANAQVRAADAQVATLEREAARTGRMEDAGVGSNAQRSQLEGQLAVARAQASAARQVVAQATAGKAQAEAGLSAATQRFDEARATAAAAGVVLSRNREPGEVVAPGASVVTLGDLDHPHLRIYVPLEAVETLQVGAPAKVRIDAHDQPFPATIARIASEAEFTPRDILTPEERVKRVFAVDLALAPAPGLLPGVPAEAELGP